MLPLPASPSLSPPPPPTSSLCFLFVLPDLLHSGQIYKHQKEHLTNELEKKKKTPIQHERKKMKLFGDISICIRICSIRANILCAAFNPSTFIRANTHARTQTHMLHNWLELGNSKGQKNQQHWKAEKNDDDDDGKMVVFEEKQPHKNCMQLRQSRVSGNKILCTTPITIMKKEYWTAMNIGRRRHFANGFFCSFFSLWKGAFV